MNFTARQHLESLIAVAIANSIVLLGPDKQWQAFEASHFWAHLLFVVFVNSWAAIAPYLRSANPQNLSAPVPPAKE